MKNLRKLILGLIILGLFITYFSSFLNFSTVNVKSKDISIEQYNEYSLNSAGYWNLTGNPIFINGTASGGDAHNWSWVESRVWFGGGNGLEGNPYIIENITIDGLSIGSCIEIINSDVYFIIRNCTVSNSGAEWYDAGIHFTNVSNGQITNCTTYLNFNGIVLFNSSRNLVNDTFVIDNVFNGIYIQYYSYYNKITNNYFNDKLIYPEAFIYSDSHCYFTEISGNVFMSSEGRSDAVEFYGKYVYNCKVSNNRIIDCNDGLDLSGINHIITDNVITYNLSKPSPSNNGIKTGSNSYIKNNTIKNYRNGIYVSGENTDVIGNNVSNSVTSPVPFLPTGNGLLLYYSLNLIIAGNSFDLNEVSGIYLLKSNHSIIIGNDFNGNGECIIEDNCSGNFFKNNLCDENETHIIQVDLLEQSFSSEEFNITFSIHDEINQSIDLASIEMWWDGTNVSSKVQNLGSGLYFISLEPITVTAGENPILLNMTISVEGYPDKYFETYLTVKPCDLVKLLQTYIIDQSFSTEEFNITFSVYNEIGQGLNFASIEMWWDSTNVSSDVQNLGNGLYFISLEPIIVLPNEDPILLNMTISVDGYTPKYFETYIAVDPDTIRSKEYYPRVTPPEVILINILLILGITGSTLGIIIYVFKRRRATN